MIFVSHNGNVSPQSYLLTYLLIYLLTYLMFVDPCIIVHFIQKNPTRCNSVSTFYYSVFIWNSTCFGRHTAYHQEPKTALAASGFSYVEGCWTCSWWTLSGTVWESAVLGWWPFLRSLLPLYKSLIFFYLTFSVKFLNFSFWIFLLFVPEMSASFTSYGVQIIYIALAWIL